MNEQTDVKTDDLRIVQIIKITVLASSMRSSMTRKRSRSRFIKSPPFRAQYSTAGRGATTVRRRCSRCAARQAFSMAHATPPMVHNRLHRR